jgi:hypothetical protein
VVYLDIWLLAIWLFAIWILDIGIVARLPAQSSTSNEQVQQGARKEGFVEKAI